MLRFFVTVYFWFYFLATSILLLPIAVIIRVFTYNTDKSLAKLHRFTAFWGFVFLFGNPFWRFSIKGQEKIGDLDHYIMISNHQSMIDIFILYQIRHQFKWIAKAELFKTPFFGQALLLNKYIKLNRTNRASMLEMMEQSKKVLNEYCSIMIFPEGTRTKTGQIQNFKDGAFKLSVETGKKVLPIVLDETMLSLPKKGFLLNRTKRFKVHILEPVSPNGKNYRELSEICRNHMVNELNSMRNG